MAKRSTKAKRSLQALPKGLPTKKRGHSTGGGSTDINPFDTNSRTKKPKHDVHNRFKTKSPTTSKLAQSLSRRQEQVQQHYQDKRKVNSFMDLRMGEYDATMTKDQQLMNRLVKERAQRSKKHSKYSLEEEQPLTHGGRTITEQSIKNHVILSDDEDGGGGNLEAMDTELHFGGGNLTSKRNKSNNPYGPSDTNMDLTQVYTQRKTELDDFIARRKIAKAEKLQSKEQQADAFGTMDDSFKELAQLLHFRDKKQERTERESLKARGLLPQEDQEMADWDKEMKEFLFHKKVKATDRTKTPEEMAKEEADRLHKLETRRMARMNGDFDDDELSDISGDEGKNKKKYIKKPSKNAMATAEKLDDSEDEQEKDQTKVRFTSEGLVQIDKDGNVVGKVGEEEGSDESEQEIDEDEEDDDDDDNADSDGEDLPKEKELEGYDSSILLPIGTRVNGNYRVKEQFGEEPKWYAGKITKVNKNKDKSFTYNIEYDDGDFENEMDPENVHPLAKTALESDAESNQLHDDLTLKEKRQKAKLKARQEMPYVFEVPTTLEALHDMIGRYAATGNEASLIIHRIHASNSVRLNKRNGEKMQNFYDVVLRRFVAVGDAIYSSGDGGPELGRYEQLNALTKVLYGMSQDAPESAGAVWGRRLGVIQNAHAKRLRDADFVSPEDDNDDDFITAWPSTGVILLLKTVGHIFPVTDLRHQVVTPTILLLGQMLAQTPVRSVHDLAMGVLCCGLMIEYTKGAKRISPEALAFLASVLRLFARFANKTPVPTIEAAWQIPELKSLRKSLEGMDLDGIPKLSLERDSIQEPITAAGVLASALELVEVSAEALNGALDNGESEAFAEVCSALLAIKAKSTNMPLPNALANKVVQCASAVSESIAGARQPLQRRAAPEIETIKSLAPRMEDPSKYTFSKDKGKSAKQAELDRNRREYKREHKAVSRELRLDSVFVEKERRREKDSKDQKAKDKRNKNFAWLEGEQAAMNQQVAQGGGLLSGGGMGAARAKARSGKMGVKKGGKL